MKASTVIPRPGAPILSIDAETVLDTIRTAGGTTSTTDLAVFTPVPLDILAEALGELVNAGLVALADRAEDVTVTIIKEQAA